MAGPVDLEEIDAATYDFADDFLYFFHNRTSETQSDAEAALIARISGHGANRTLLDLGCGGGRIANRLAALGGAVVGLDRSVSLIAHARANAAARGVAPDYLVGDMRELATEAAFDTILSWYSSFGFEDDVGNLAILERCRRALRPSGLLVLEVNNRDELLRTYRPAIAVRRGDDLLVDENAFDPVNGRTTIRRTIVRDRRLVRAEFSLRLYAFTELRATLERAGFSEIEVFSGTGEAFTASAARMIVTARRADHAPPSTGRP